MGRPRATDEQRLAAVPERQRVELLAALALHRQAVAQAELAREVLRSKIAAAVDAGASYRDLETLTGMPRASLNQLVKPYRPKS